jgi:long-chain acyl-CoA synthetase
MYKLESFTVPELIEKGSREYAGRPALAMVGKEAVPYEELEPRSRKIAAFLGLLGIGRGDRVAILSENRPEWGLAAFGICRTGAIVVPILTDFTSEQIANILEHSASAALFVSRRFLTKIQGQGEKRILISVEDLEVMAGHATPSGKALEAAAAAFAPPSIEGNDLAAIVYTSGTTGLSKGVMLSHRNIVYDAWACRRFILLHRRDRFLSILPLAHTYEFTIGLIIPIMHGSAVYYLDRPPSATALLPALRAVRPTIMLTVPLVIEKIFYSTIQPKLEAMKAWRTPLLRPLIARLAGAQLLKSFGGKIRFFGIGGAPLAADVESFLNTAHFPYSIGYGLTETAPMLAGNSPGKVKVHTTGVGATGVEIRIADPRPDTGEGEIQVRGPNVTRGYYRDPERTKEIFTADGWFRTGDLGRMDKKGLLTVRGRIKTMILGASGENIYPEEIEAVLNSSPYIVESLVYGDEQGLTALVQVRPEVMAELGAIVKDGIDEAEEAASRLGLAVGSAIEHAGESLEHAEKRVTRLLERIRKDANERLAAFSRIRKVELQVEPFEKTPTQKIKRFLYPKKQ